MSEVTLIGLCFHVLYASVMKPNAVTQPQMVQMFLMMFYHLLNVIRPFKAMSRSWASSKGNMRQARWWEAILPHLLYHSWIFMSLKTQPKVIEKRELVKQLTSETDLTRSWFHTASGMELAAELNHHFLHSPKRSQDGGLADITHQLSLSRRIKPCFIVHSLCFKADHILSQTCLIVSSLNQLFLWIN